MAAEHRHASTTPQTMRSNASAYAGGLGARLTGRMISDFQDTAPNLPEHLKMLRKIKTSSFGMPLL
jgi:hypothetical protein